MTCVVKGMDEIRTNSVCILDDWRTLSFALINIKGSHHRDQTHKKCGHTNFKWLGYYRNLIALHNKPNEVVEKVFS